MFDDRIEIISTGGLPEGLSLEEFYEGCSKPRCPELMRILRDLEYVEQSGFGINKIIEVCGKGVFRITDNFIPVVLPYDRNVIKSQTGNNVALNDGTQTAFTEDELKHLINGNNKITRRKIAEHFGMPLRTLQRYLNKIESVQYVGSGKSGYWEIK